MDRTSVERPKADKKKIHSKNDFELCYIRHQYFRKTKFNPTKDEMQPFMAIATHFAKNTYFTYKNLFHMVGFECVDLISIAQIHLVSFLGLFSLDKMPQKYEEFVEIYKNANQEGPKVDDVLNKNKANFTMFLKQRMEDVVRVCRQKARNIKGLPAEEFYFYYGPKRPPRFLRDLIGHHEKYGFRKLDNAVYKSIRKKVKKDDSPVFRFDGNYYIAVPVEQKSLSITDFCGADMNPYDSIHNMTPEQIFFAGEERSDWAKKQEEFDSKPKNRQANVIKKFIRNHKDNPKFKEEVKIARKFLKENGV